MATYQYTAASWQAVEDQLSSVQQNLLAAIQELESAAAAHLAEWNDQAKEIYTVRQQQWHTQAAVLPQKMSAVVQASAGMRATLQQASTFAANTFGG
jgi:hypothetical protein